MTAKFFRNSSRIKEILCDTIGPSFFFSTALSYPYGQKLKILIRSWALLSVISTLWFFLLILYQLLASPDSFFFATHQLLNSCQLHNTFNQIKYLIYFSCIKIKFLPWFSSFLCHLWFLFYYQILIQFFLLRTNCKKFATFRPIHARNIAIFWQIQRSYFYTIGIFWEILKIKKI